MSFLKETFKDVFQEMLEAEMVSKMTEKLVPEIREWQIKLILFLITVILH